MAKKIKLTHGKFALVDESLHKYLNQFKWYAFLNGNTYYARRAVRVGKGVYRLTFMHHVIKGKPKTGFVTDHVDGNGLNNTVHNLRYVSQRVNSQNHINKRRKKYSSQYPGVSWFKRDKKWCAQALIKKQARFLGYFNSEFEAAQAYQAAVKGKS